MILSGFELENLFLIRSEILGLLVNKLTFNYEYSRIDRENLPLSIQIKLCKKAYNFPLNFVAFLVSP